MGWLSKALKSATKLYDPTNALGLAGSKKKSSGLKGLAAFDANSPTGVGSTFLNSLDWGAGAGLSMDKLASNPFGGGAKQNYSPAFIAKFLKGEMGPGGALGAASQSRITALGMGQVVGGGETDIAQQQRGLAASGVASPALAAIRTANRSVLADRSRGYLTQRKVETEQQRYDAMEGFVNMVAATVAANKNQQLNYSMSKDAASATTKAGYAAAAGNIIGGLIP